MKKIVVNKCYGGFDLSFDAVMRYAEIKGIAIFAYIQPGFREDFVKIKASPSREKNPVGVIYYTLKDMGRKIDTLYSSFKDCFSVNDLERDDPALVQVVEELGKKANSTYSELVITEIPDGVKWEIGEYDGQEWVEEAHKRW